MNGYSRFKDEMAVIERLGRENLDLIEETIKRYGIDCQFEWTGELRIANEEWQIEGLVDEANLRNSFGDNVEVLGQEEIQARVNSPLSKAALWDPDGTALVDPARLVWGLERACLKLGVKIFENTHVEWLERTSEGIAQRQSSAAGADAGTDLDSRAATHRPHRSCDSELLLVG